MRAFSSCHDYRTFARSIMRRSRYVFEPAVEEFLKTVADTAEKRKATAKAGGLLYRAQLGFEWESHLLDSDHPEDGTFEVREPMSRDRMKPLRDSAREGRVNPKGIPCLYLADEPNTAMAETRPWLASYVSMAEFKINRDLQIIDCSKPKLYAGMGGSAAWPLGPTAVSRNFSIPASPQRANSLPAEVKSGDVLCQPFTSRIGWKSSVAPFNHLDVSSSLVSVLGVWHSWHLHASSTKYFPRAAESESCGKP